MMATLPVCSTTASSSSHSKIPIYGGFKSFSSCWKTYQMKCNVMDLASSFHLHGASFRGQLPISLYSKFVHKSNLFSSICSCSRNVFEGELLTNHLGMTNDSSGNLRFVDSSVGAEEMIGFSNDLVNIAPESITTVDLTPVSILDSDTSSSSAMDVFNKSITDSLDEISSSVRGATQAVDDVISKLTEASGNGVAGLKEASGNGVAGLKEASGRVGVVAVDALRHIILIVEDSVSRLVVYSYGSVKEILPPEVQDALNVSEERAVKLLTPFGTALGQQGYAALERSLGLDPSDPIVPFVLLLGASTSFWAFYWILTYGGYAGDLSPKSSFELLKGDRNAVLIDIRPEDIREKEGIPDLRRAARSRFANVTLPEIDGSVRKLFKSRRELDDYLLAAVIRNLKIVQDSSQVIVMDANGNNSKGIARSLRRLGIKEAEAIFEEINPTPLQVVGYGVGLVAAAYALVEWEKTLQYVGVFGLCQTLYRRISSYEESEDFKQDVRQLLAPVRLGGQAMTWAVGKLETNRNRNGLPTSPSSTDVQSRVLQAAAKHESQPDNEEIQDPSPDTMASVNENVDLSEA
ncbi:uncharacterized protein LOC132045853 isoform X3 [Lycium ferocissimum]|uniref:uncharacterized protein LOC132045853 isoform X3 n=1 Tax=Lycium ferocissimum TaxID=112874 RepID=UPI002815929B|nr:uncharacterized protein LOC132045853 isoform X3 [Lycium ferocissimum]